MIPEFEIVTLWLAETYMHGTAILVIAVAALSSIKQPVRRMPVAWGAFAGLVALAILPALSWWPRIELPVWQRAAAIAAQPRHQPTASDESDARDGLAGEATFGSGIRENSRQMSRQVGILKNSAAYEMASTEPYRAFDEPLESNLTGWDENPPVPADIVSIPQNEAAETKTERVTSIDVERALLSWPATTTGLWLAGALLASIWIAAGAWRTQRLFRRSHAVPGWVRDDLRRIVPAHRREPKARVSQEIAAALAYGAIRPAILLRDPELRDAPTEAETRRGIRAALAHEYAHIAHGDLWLLALERLLLPVYFAHPLFWVLRRWIRIDQELLADAAAAADHPVEYAEALLEWAKLAPAAGSPRFSAALPLWSSPCHLKRRIEMLLDAGNPIARQASRLWRAAVVTTITVLASGLSLVTFQPVHSAEDGVDRPPAIETISDAKSSEPRPAPAAPPEPIPAAHIVAFGITLVQVDNAKLAGLGTSLSKLVDAACEPARRSKSKDGVVAGYMPAQSAQKLVEDIKSLDAGRIVAEPRISAVFEANPVYATPAEGANAARHKNVSVRSEDLLITIHAQPIDRGRHEPMCLTVSAGVEFTPRADADSSADHNLQVSSSFTRKVSYAAQLQLGDSLIIVGGSNDRHPGVKADFANLIVVTPLTVTPTEGSNSQTGHSRDVEALRQVVNELKDEIRGLRQQSAQEANRPRPPGVGGKIERELLLLDVQEAELNVNAANDAYELACQIRNTKEGGTTDVASRQAALRKAQNALRRAQLRAEHGDRPPAAAAADIKDEEASSFVEELQELEALEAQAELLAAKGAYAHGKALHAKGLLGDSELAARKLALQKAEIAKQRIELRVKSFQPPAVETTTDSSKSGGGRESLQKQKKNIESLESELENAKEPNQTAARLRNAAAEVRSAELRLQRAETALKMEIELSREPTEIPAQPDTQTAARLRNAAAEVISAELRLQKAKELLEMEIELSREPPEVPAQPDTDGAGKKDNNSTEECQITLRTRIVEVPNSSLQQIQAEYNDALNPNKFFAEIASGKVATLTGILDSGDATVLDKLLDADKKAKVVFDSRVTVRSGHPARFLSKGEIAVPVTTEKTAEGGDSISFRGAGISLFVVPTVQDGDLIRMQIRPEFSAIDVGKTVNGIPGVNSRRVQTTVELREGQVFALTGLLSTPDSVANVDRTPMLKKAPAASQLFKQQPQAARDDARVLILVTPEIVRPKNSRAVPQLDSRDATSPSSEPPSDESKADSMP